MGTTALRQLLKSFCINLPWNYAVFWKLRHEGGQMIFSWEDGYYDNSKPRGPVGIMSGDIYCNGDNELFSYYCNKSAGDGGGSEGYSVGQVVANMLHLQYALGEGVVGEVAITGNHFWASFNNVSIGKVNSKLVPECPDEWLLQLASGIKTILLVPVLPHGVMQLGSLEVVGEDLAVVACIKDRFTLHNAGVNTVLSILNRDLQTVSSSTLTSGLMDSLDEPSASTISPLKSEDSDTVDSVKPSKILLSTLDHVVSLLALQDALNVSGNGLSETFGSESENKTGILSVGLNEVPKSPNHSVYAGKLEMMDSKLFGLSCLEEGLQAYSQCNKYNVEVLGEFNGGTMTSYPARDSMEQPFQEDIFNDAGHRSSVSLLNFPQYCELQEALGPAFHRHPSEYLWDSFSVDNTCSSSSLVCNRDLSDGIEPTSSGKVGDVEYLLEAVVANVCMGADGASNICNNVNSSLTSFENFVTPSQPQSQSKTSALAGDDSILWSNIKSACLSGSRSELTPTSASFKSTTTTFVDKKQLEKGYSAVQSRKGLKQSNVNKRRNKPTDNQRPRPRDRQLIQDRIKELRELVPNGARCSIDGLLGKTIEHMQHLRSVTDQAEKLKQWVHHEVAARKDIRSSETNQNGTTWAFEFGNELMVCPVVVEDLAYPGHMLIEMLCNENGLFLDITQVIRSYELTILKGVMESRSDNTWAHFIVEASKSFHRTEIFWPLMHLLLRKRNPISSKI